MQRGQDFWFPAKRYGWGWGLPVKWQGWVVLAAFVAAACTIAIRFPPRDNLPLFLALLLLACAVLGLVCWWKGETPAWRWGEKKSR